MFLLLFGAPSAGVRDEEPREWLIKRKGTYLVQLGLWLGL